MRCATKARPRVKGGKGFSVTYMPEEYVTWKQNFAVYCMAQGPVTPLDGPLRMTVIASYKDKRRKDVDNIAGAVMDALNGIAYADDEQVFDLHSVKVYSQPHDCIVVDIGQIV
jgi:Holliday junction resolvase RusA-like endonuclease